MFYRGMQVCGSEPVGQAAGLHHGGDGAAYPGQPQLHPALSQLVVQFGEGVEGG